MADINKFTTKEVLNKVLLDSSGNAVAAYSHTSQEALNAVLDTSNNRLNISIAGGTISGDVTISGDLTVEGNGTGNYDEVVNGNSHIVGGILQVSHDSDRTENILLYARDTARFSGTAFPGVLETVGCNTLEIGTAGSQPLYFATNATPRMTISNTGDVGIGVAPNSNFKTYIYDNTNSASAWGLQVYQQGAGGNGLRVDVASTDASDYIFQAGANDGGTQVLSVMADGAISASPNADQTFEFGRTKITAKDTDYMYISHYDMSTGNNWAIRQNSSGGTQVNSASGQVLNLSIANSAKLTLNSNSRISLSNNDSGGTGGVDSTSGNTLLGYLAGNSIASGGTNNTVLGHKSLQLFGSSSGGDNSSYNTAIGDRAMGGGHNTTTNNTGFKNVAIGQLALGGSTGTSTAITAHSNVVIGFEAGKVISSANNNVFIGRGAGDAVTTGSSNTAVGSGAGGAIIGGSNNVAVGTNALLASTSGIENLAIGRNALAATTTQNRNIALGYFTGASITGSDAIYNVLIGDYSGTGGSGNLKSSIAIGYQALDATGSNNVTGAVAIGYNALTALTSGAGTTAIGYEAGQTLSTGNNNTFLGYQTGKSVTHSNNVAIGTIAFNTASSAEDSVIIGYSAGTAITTGDGNVAIGHEASVTLTTGSNNTIIGRGANVSASGAVGQIAIGTSVACTGDNTITVGIGANTASLGLDGSDESWAAASSDERLKENIESSSAGLNVINDLRPVTYNWKKAKNVQKDLPQYKDSDEPVLGTKYGEQLHGFIAQEVKEVIDNHDELKDGFKMWKLKDDGTQTVASGNLIPILVKAVQELSARVKELESK